MIPDYCPLGKYNCSWCEHLTTAGCNMKPQSTFITVADNTATFSTETEKDRRKMYREIFEKLMQCDKEMLVQMILGSEENFVNPILH